MNVNKILTLVLFIVAIGLAYYLFSRIKFSIDEEKAITRSEAQVINKLELLREAEIAYYSVNSDYTDNWDTLAMFMQNGVFYITERSEEIIPMEYAEDSVIVTIDTLYTVPVYDSLFSPTKRPGLNFETLSSVPGTDAEFDLFVDEITKGGVTVDVIEIRDTKPRNPNRKESNEARNRKPLRFGSRTDVTTAGNWE